MGRIIIIVRCSQSTTTWKIIITSISYGFRLTAAVYEMQRVLQKYINPCCQRTGELFVCSGYTICGIGVYYSVRVVSVSTEHTRGERMRFRVVIFGEIRPLPSTPRRFVRFPYYNFIAIIEYNTQRIQVKMYYICITFVLHYMLKSLITTK